MKKIGRKGKGKAEALTNRETCSSPQKPYYYYSAIHKSNPHNKSTLNTNQLSEEQLRTNNQLQEDELLAVEAIYGDNLTNFKRGGQLSFQIHIHIETPDELTISAELNSSTDNGRIGGTSNTLLATVESSSGVLHTFKVEHLPPLVLTCLLPKSYPSHSPPYFTLSVQWLDSLRISNLCSMLDSLWTDQTGQEVIYHWVEWLRCSSLSFLGIDKEIRLCPFNTLDSGDRRAHSGNLSPDVVIPSMINYNDAKCHEVFQENVHECSICFSEYAGPGFLRLPCKHFFCWKCMETYSSIHVKDGTVNKLLCPEMKCGGQVPPNFLKCLLGHEDFKRWESLLLQKTLDAMSDVKYCPRCQTACLDDGDCHAQCAKCYFSFCCICYERRHVGVNCVSPEIKLQILQEQQDSDQVGEEVRRRNQEMINEILSLKEILRDAKQCPSCNTAVSRIDGCNKMVCQNCGQYFCYRCNKAIKGYDHFSSKGCTVFPDRKTQEQERQEAERNLGETKYHPCPICAQQNAKVGSNNHIVCLTCRNHYCYLCKKSFRHGNQHFTNTDCTQYTVG